MTARQGHPSIPRSVRLARRAPPGSTPPSRSRQAPPAAGARPARRAARAARRARRARDAPLVVVLRAGRHRQDHGAPAVGRGRRPARRLGAARRGRRRPRRAAHLPVARALEAVTDVDPSRGRVALARRPAGAGARPAAAGRGAGGGARRSCSCWTTRTCSERRQAVGGRRLRAAQPAAGRAAGARVRAPTRRSRSRACARPASSPSSARRSWPSTADEAAELLRLHGCDADDDDVDASARGHRGLGHRSAAGLPRAAGRPPAEWLPQVRGEPPRDRRVPHRRGARARSPTSPGVPAAHLGAHELTPRPVRAGHRTGRRRRAPRARRARGALRRPARRRRLPLPLPPPLRRDARRPSWSAAIPGGRDEPAPHGRAPGTRSATCRTPAVHHLLAAGEAAAAGDVVAAAWPAMWSRGQAETVRRWLESFTTGRSCGHQALTLTAGWVYTALDAGELGDALGQGGLRRADGRRALARRRRVAALVAGAAARHRRRPTA